MNRLVNEQIALGFSPEGSLVELTHVKVGHNHSGGLGLWRLYGQVGDEIDVEITPPLEAPATRRDGDTLILEYVGAQMRGCPVKILVQVRVSLVGDESHWTIELKNEEPGLTIRECQFPLVGNLNLPQGHGLIWSKSGGERVADVKEEIRRQHSQFMAQDHIFLSLLTLYPANTAAMNCFLLAGEKHGLYLGCHDPSLEYTGHSLRLYGDKLEAGFARYPVVAPGSSAKLNGFVLAPYQGSWHDGAFRYRTWADSWFRPARPPAWVSRMNGWQRIILKHQYGEKHYQYDQLPQIEQEGSASGIANLFMFGWWKGGMDNGNPEYVPAADLGGEGALRKGVADFQSKGGAVILYSNGKLIDTTSAFYLEKGKRLSIKDALGHEVHEAYRFRTRGSYYTQFRNRTFAVACPACPEWAEVLIGIADLAADYGCKAVFYDQVGMGDYPCCDPSHGHPVPFMGIMKAKVELTEKLRAAIKARHPDMGFGIEWLSDAGSQHIDFIHSLTGFAGVVNDWEKTGEKPVARGFVDFFRYLFPEIIMSDREIRDDRDIERRVNHAVMKGLRSDVEIYRCRKTIAETPHYGAYLKEVNALRQRQADILLEGRYRDTQGFLLSNREWEGRAFTRGDDLAVVVSQSHLDACMGEVSAEGYQFFASDGVGKFEVAPKGKGASLKIFRHGLVVLKFRKVLF